MIHTQDSVQGEATETVWLRGWRHIRPDSARARRDTDGGGGGRAVGVGRRRRAIERVVVAIGFSADRHSSRAW